MDSVPTIVARYIDAYNRMNVQAMLDCLSGDVRFINRSNGETTNETHGIEAFRALAEQGVQLFAEREQTILDCIAIDDRAAVRIGYRAKVKTDLPNGWKAGQEIEMTGTSFFMISEGKISEVIDAS
ncbi:MULTISPECIES: nuclear transport factor 2 family protein [Alphaproteobacteria]|jgi:predicted ester cyclase|uniref:SnoaL-like domain-containing protein n=4 Tax=Alphaproteobacteria TaxID=28211 RepID=A0A1I3H6Q1_9HYPH|nr:MULTISPECIES: nuclear transport factor 2 family protein [Alphaproteobacteria]MBV2186459.1 nuclear transport factor 2 family protein [Rhizobium sp.]QPA29494.1 nuclear transport factor 2 family protein [Brucella anthropi]HTO29520.1 nuclear transport factor 2 family protein [Devosia sp.]MCC5777952.1 nuclear transport factor 2 family protein [Nitratireductor sp. B36]NNV21125.1 nuclear transport factor 2 family protein [Brucella pseudogrignonensis]